MNLNKIWDNSKRSVVELCYLIMSEKLRSHQRCFRFDDIQNRLERKKSNQLAPIRNVFETFFYNFQNNFIASEFLIIHEQILAFRGHCCFKQCIPSKPERYGIKMFVLVDQ